MYVINNVKTMQKVFLNCNIKKLQYIFALSVKNPNK